jgi:hypothetical protein
MLNDIWTSKTDLLYRDNDTQKWYHGTRGEEGEIYFPIPPKEAREWLSLNGFNL